MSRCPNCGCNLRADSIYCPNCGAAFYPDEYDSGRGEEFDYSSSHPPYYDDPVPPRWEDSDYDEEYDSYDRDFPAGVTLYVTEREARTGCTTTVRYPGAPAPVRVSLPKGMFDGMVLYLSNAQVCDENGDIAQGTLKLLIRVQRSTPKAWPLVALAAAAAMILCWLILRESGIVSPEVTAAPAVITEVPVIDIPAETPAVTESPTANYTPTQLYAAAVIPHFEIRYVLNTLDDRLLENFLALYSAASNFEETCTFPREMSREEFSQLALMLSYECPELLQFSTTGEISFTTNAEGRVVSAIMPLVLSRQEFAAEYGVCSDRARALAESCVGMSDSEKEMAAYDYLTSHCFYNFNGASASNAYGALGEGQAKCDGISLAMKWLLEEMGIPCMVMAGTTSINEVGHAWNIVCIDGEYYDLDVTNDVMSRDRDYRYYGAYNVSRFWIREKYNVNVSFEGFIELPGALNMNNSYHNLRGHYIYANSEYKSILFDQLNSLESGSAAFLQFESPEDFSYFVNNINNIMAAWPGSSKGSYSYNFSHLDEFRVCRVTITFN